MKVLFVLTIFAAISLHSFRLRAQSDKVGTEPGKKSTEHLYLDVHHLGPGKVTAAAVAEAHQKDLAVEGKYGVNFINYWVNGTVVVCLSQAPDSSAVIQTHKEAHGLIPQHIMQVKPGEK